MFLNIRLSSAVVHLAVEISDSNQRSATVSFDLSSGPLFDIYIRSETSVRIQINSVLLSVYSRCLFSF